MCQSTYLAFSGENRRRSLERIIAEYDAVAAQATAGNTTSPSGRLVHIRAEAGLGKTRLAIELYRHLTANTAGDSTRYWPCGDTSKMGMTVPMPVLQDCEYDAPMPFLWWGMSVVGSDNKNAITRSIDAVLPHLTILRLGQGRDQREEPVLRIVADGFADLMIGTVEEFSGIGYVKRLLQFIWDVKNSVVEQSIGHESVEVAMKQQDSVIDTVLLQLDELLAPTSPHFASIPAVIIIDDAHFSYGELTTAKFVESVIARMSTRNWPVLLVIMHWEYEQHTRMSAGDMALDASPIAKVIEHARIGDQESRGAFAGELGGSLDSYRYIEVDLSEPVDDLRMAIMAEYPKFDSELVDNIADKVRGNPRKLEQVLSEMRIMPVWFTDKRCPEILSAEGLKHVMTLTGLEVDKIALARFRGLPEAVRRSLTLSSMLGFSFLVTLIERIQCSTEGARLALEEAESVYRLVRNVSDRSKNDLGQFSEYLYLEVARTYRRVGLVYTDIIDWPGEEVVQNEIDRILGEIAANGEALLGLNSEDQTFCIWLAADRFYALNDYRAGIALAKLVGIENALGNFESAGESARRFMFGLQAGNWRIEHVGFSLTSEVAKTLYRVGELKDAALVWKNIIVDAEKIFVAKSTASDIGRSVVSLNQDDASTGRWLAHAYNSLGVVYKIWGQLDEAVAYYKEALHVYHELDMETGMASVYTDMGNIHRVRGEFELAEEMNKKALKINTEHGYEKAMASNMGNLGTVYNAQKMFDAAIQAYREAIKVNTKLGEIEGIASDHNNLGIVYQNLHEFDTAIEMYKYALLMHKKMDNKLGVALAYGNLGVAYWDCKELELAVEMYTNALEIDQELDHTEGMARQYFNLGEVHHARGELKEARSVCNLSLALFQQVQSPHEALVQDFIKKLDNEL